MHEAPREHEEYQRYQELGGIINEKDYESALLRSKNAVAPSRSVVRQAKFIAETAGIALASETSADKRVILYGILRTDSKPTDIKYHHSQMSDQRLFAEALRMVGDADSLHKLLAAFPNISF